MWHLDILTGHQIVASKSGEVFGNNRADLAVLHVPDQALEVGTIEVSSRPTVVNVYLDVSETVAFGVFREHGFLIRYAVAFALQVVIIT